MTTQAELAAWLRANQRTYADGRTVILDDFVWTKPDDYGAAFMVSFGANSPKGRSFAFADGAGEIQIQEPMFTSPLGVPASFGAVDIEPDVRRAILVGARTVIPRIRPYGIDKATGTHITAATPLAARVVESVRTIRNRLEADGFQISVDVATLAVRTHASV